MLRSRTLLILMGGVPHWIFFRRAYEARHDALGHRPKARGSKNLHYFYGTQMRETAFVVVGSACNKKLVLIIKGNNHKHYVLLSTLPTSIARDV